MSLVIAFIGKAGSIVAGDMREITFEGEKEDREKLTKKLYKGAIVSDEELEKRQRNSGSK